MYYRIYLDNKCAFACSYLLLILSEHPRFCSFEDGLNIKSGKDFL